MALWKRIFISSQLTLTNIYGRIVAIPGIVKLLFPMDKLSAYAEFVLNRITCVGDSDELKEYLCKRGYEKYLLDEEVQRAVSIPRETCLRIKKDQEKTSRTPLVVTYHPLLPSFASITRRHLHILHITERLRTAFPSPPLIAFRRPKNLKDLLV